MMTVAVLLLSLAGIIFWNALRDYRRGFILYGTITIDRAETPETFRSTMLRRIISGLIIIAIALGVAFIQMRMPAIPSQLKFALSAGFMAVVAAGGVRFVRRAWLRGTIALRLNARSTPVEFCREKNPAGYWATLTFYIVIFLTCAGVALAAFVFALGLAG